MALAGRQGGAGHGRGWQAGHGRAGRGLERRGLAGVAGWAWRGMTRLGRGWQAWTGEVRRVEAGLAGWDGDEGAANGMDGPGPERKVEMSPMLKRITDEDARQARREIIYEIIEAVFLFAAMVIGTAVAFAVF